MRRTLHGLQRTTIVAAMVLLVATTAAGQATDPPPPSIGRVFREVPRDLWKFVSWDTAMVLGVGGGAAAIGHIWDDDLASELETNVRLNDAFGPGHTGGAFAFQVLIGASLYSGGWFAKKGRLAQTGADIMRAQILSQAYVQALKFSVRRERPDKSDDLSFPSGHAASAFATARVLQRRYGWKVGVPATVFAAYVATARVHDDKHYLSDVIFGASMGVAAERTVSLRAGRYQMAFAPMVGGGTTGVRVAVNPR